MRSIAPRRVGVCAALWRGYCRNFSSEWQFNCCRAALGQPLSEASDILQPDDLVGANYVVERLVGGGGMGQVFVARDTRLERRVTIKLLHPDLGDSALATARFEREAKMLSRVVHPNVVAIYDYGQHNGAFYIVMEYVDGESLAEWLGRKGPMQLDEVLTVTRQIASGLAEAHALGIIHRDIKPGNLLLRRLVSGGLLAKVVDFGLARSYEEHTSITTAQGILGTPSYMSPEQIQGQPLDGRSDLYSLAVVVHEMLTGRAPFWRDTVQSTLMAHLVEEPPKISVLARGGALPLPFQVELTKALAKSPAGRHNDMRAFIESLAVPSGFVQPTSNVATMRCCTCSRSIATTCDFCPHCGAPAPLESCPSCGVAREGQRLFCSGCSAALVVSGRHSGQGGLGTLIGAATNERGGSALLHQQTATVVVAQIRIAHWNHTLQAELVPLFNAAVEREGGRALAVLGAESFAIFGLGGMRVGETEAAVDAGLALLAGFERLAKHAAVDAKLSIGIDVGALSSVPVGIGWGVAYAGGLAIEQARQAMLLLAEGGVCIGPAAYRDVRSAYNHKPLDRDYRLILSRKAVSYVDYMGEKQPLVGRDVESGLLLRTKRKVLRTRTMQVVAVQGPSGSGKTRLLADFLRGVEDSSDDWHADIARCGTARMAQAYEPFVHMLRTRLKAEEHITVAELGKRLERLVHHDVKGDPPELARQRARTLARLLGSQHGPADTLQALPSGPDERAAAFEAFTAYLDAAAVKHPILLVIEDFQRASPTTLDLLQHVIKRAAEWPVMIVLTCGGDDVGALLERLAVPHEYFTRVELNPLELEDCAALMAARLEGFSPPDFLVQAVLSFADGLPGHVEEAVETLLDSRLVASHDGVWAVADPERIDEVLARSHADVLATALNACRARREACWPPSSWPARQRRAGCWRPWSAARPLKMSCPNSNAWG